MGTSGWAVGVREVLSGSLASGRYRAKARLELLNDELPHERWDTTYALLAGSVRLPGGSDRLPIRAATLPGRYATGPGRASKRAALLRLQRLRRAATVSTSWSRRSASVLVNRFTAGPHPSEPPPRAYVFAKDGHRFPT